MTAAVLPPYARTSSSFDYIAAHLEAFHGIPKRLASERLHDIKKENGRQPADNVLFDLTGGVWAPENGELLGYLAEGGAKGP